MTSLRILMNFWLEIIYQIDLKKKLQKLDLCVAKNMIKKIYKFNWLLFLILILITPFMSAAVAVGYLSIWNQLEIRISNISSVYIISKQQILYINVFILLISIILLFSISFYFGYQLISNTFTYEQIEISIDNIQKKLLKKIEYKLLTIKNYKKWLFKNNIEYQIIDKKLNKNN